MRSAGPFMRSHAGETALKSLLNRSDDSELTRREIERLSVSVSSEFLQSELIQLAVLLAENLQLRTAKRVLEYVTESPQSCLVDLVMESTLSSTIALFYAWNPSICECRTQNGHTLLHALVEEDRPGQLLVLLALGARVDCGCGVDNDDSPLCIAVRNKNPRMIESLLRNGANPRRTGCFPHSQTPLELAIESGDDTVICVLRSWS